MTLTYNPKKTSPEKLAGIIQGLGYRTAVVAPADADGGKKKTLKVAPVPGDAPAFFSEAMTRAEKSGRPVVIDFWASWCVPCRKLKSQTMTDPKVARALKDVEVIFVDLDRHPGLAKAYGVKSIPDVFFVNAEGVIVDRLRKFEEAAPFLERVRRLCSMKLAPVPKNAPRFFSEAMARARKAGKPVVIDFWAEWCVPCRKLKSQTMADPKVAGALKGFEVIFVDLDKHPELAKAYGVKSIPDVFFLDAEGMIVDRLKHFEKAGPFLQRLVRLIGSKE